MSEHSRGSDLRCAGCNVDYAPHEGPGGVPYCGECYEATYSDGPQPVWRDEGTAAPDGSGWSPWVS